MYALLTLALFLIPGVLFLTRSYWFSNKRNPVSFFGTNGGDIELAIHRLLTTPGAVQEKGFVIFKGYSGSDFVQYGIERNGLILDWPVFQPGGQERLQYFIDQIETRGFRDRTDANMGKSGAERINDLSEGEYVVQECGLHAQVGRNASEIRELTITLLREVFGVTDLNYVEITLCLDG